MESLQHVKDLPNVTCLELDVTDKESIKRAVESVRKSGKGGGKLRYLVNNAGRGVVGPILDGDEVIERGVWEVNYWYVFDFFS
jgi:NAD(P)-dependent dehydrogenase (short-subunit alcohol dehydrogenase family)